MNIEQIQNSLMLHPRFKHSVGVMKMALKLNKMHKLNVPEDKIKVAALLHDVAKNIDFDEQIELLLVTKPEAVNEELYKALFAMHSFTGSVVAKLQYNIDDEEVLNAIFYHTTGKPNMNNLEKLIFLADYIEEGRVGKGYEEVREIAYKNIDDAIIRMYEYNFEYLNKENRYIHSLSIKAYNYYKGEKRC